ncbi:alpha/beta fold hydrolase [Mucilaginibacter rubeus]|uniref:alpha/beta fold hydrolase n=1 Tax=Mucilaginibacter rubeus TaxID=2027860 RepID=UPI00166ADE1F|nr:alpha/beta hydrolase [Mucilaginibacter rubeus]
MKSTLFQQIKTWLAYALKMASVILSWFIVYLTLIYITNGMLQGAVAALGGILIAGLTLILFIGRSWVKPGVQRYVIIIIFGAFMVFVIHTSTPLASNDNPKPAPDFSDVPTCFWNLKTGSHIAYYKIAAKPGIAKKTTPIIFLHGGPGAYVRKLDLDFFKTFAIDGYDVYLYDQVGSGRSGLLPKSGYSHLRNILDFEAIVNVINAKQYIVIGQSYGGSLLADIASDSRMAGRIYKAVYAEPGVTVSSAGTATFTRSPNALNEDVNLPLRAIIGILINPGGDFTSQNEILNYMSNRQDLVQKLFIQSFPKDDRNSIPKVEPGLINFSVIGIIPPQVAVYNKDLKTKFQHNKVRSMLMLGESSYIERNAPLDLLRINPGIERVQYFKNAGHILWNGLHNNNVRVKNSIDEFLNDAPPALPNYPTLKDIPEFIRSRK